ncbi:ectonucleotide pyrophosphatase/phosphodiesterase [Brevundimonas sp.]|uniref:alkaline phosphatase family protein n=1 Tax=Brevundimonas sp. TaxID=1871086 RepID=UPI0025FC02D3|nr:ectonucleotide pyrophosphatase/phosphodiesterase [Brevundimonas sp.]
MRRLLLLSLMLLAVAAPAAARPLILIGIDGFRADYLARGLTPNLARLAEAGATAEGGMRPSYPTVTFPNFYTLATGLHPDHHGLVYNTMTDASLPGRTFRLSDRAEVMDRVWYDAGEPIWVTAERAGIRTATMFWPGSEAPIGGVRPTYWLPFEQSLTSLARVNILLGWLSLPPEERPRFATLYFDIVDTRGHWNGPGSQELEAALVEVDTAVGRLLEGLAARGIEADFVVVADHGMAEVSGERIVWLDDLVPATAITLVGWGAFAGLDPQPEQVAEVETALLGEHPHMSCWRKGEVPERLAFGSHPRIPAIICMAEVGWTIGTRGRTDPMRVTGGAHGYDNAAPEMRALFIASGPSFASGVRLTDVDSVDVQPLLGRLLGIDVPAGDGRLADTAPALR